MRTVEVDRRVLATEPVALPTGEVVDAAWVASVFDQHRLPDGFPFVVDDDGTVTGCRHLNQYLLEAHAQDAFDLGSMRRFHVYNLARLLRFLRCSRASYRASVEGVPVQEWLEINGEPKVDLTDATRMDLIAYRDGRKHLVEASTLKTELGCIAGFYRYAVARGWMEADPVPRWGASRRNTLLPRTRKVRIEKFLTVEQARHFLNVGVRGDGSPADEVPAFPERDYSYGLVLATTGLRREEAAFLLDCEIPAPHGMSADGVYRFQRTGKKGYTRTVYVTAEAVQALDMYRVTERQSIVAKAQPRLRRLRRQGDLYLVEGLTTSRGRPAVLLDGHKILVERLADEERACAAYVADDGTIQPLGLFLARGGLPPTLSYWNELFADARDRVALRGGSNRPPEHITVTPHTMRHTYAVRMLAALMREGRERTDDPYCLLANPLLTVMQLLGHASILTTQEYLYAAERWNDEVPDALRRTAAGLVGHTADDPGEMLPTDVEDEP